MTWNLVRLIRSKKLLERSIDDLSSTRVSAAVIGLPHAVQTTLIVAKAAWENKESRGCRFGENRATTSRWVSSSARCGPMSPCAGEALVLAYGGEPWEQYRAWVSECKPGDGVSREEVMRSDIILRAAPLRRS